MINQKPWLAVLLVLSLVTASSSPAASQPQDPLDLLQQLAGDSTSVEYHAETGQVRFLLAEAGSSLIDRRQLGETATAEEAAGKFLDAYGTLFGLQQAGQELQHMRSTTGQTGQAYVRYQQVYQGIPVLGGEMIVAASRDLSITSAGGEILPAPAVNVQPTVEANAAQQTAILLAAKEHGLLPEDLQASEPELWIYNPALLGEPGKPGSALVWRVEVTPIDLLPVRELVLVDAHKGSVRLNFNQVDTLLSRSVYDKNNSRDSALPGKLVLSEGGAATSILDANKAYQFAGDTYHFYRTYHQRDGINGKGLPIVSTVRYCFGTGACPYPNAFWDGRQMVYGEGMVVDDVVAHELTHGVTQYSSNLFYYMQSGAINEVFSDLWGELVDLTNGAGNDSPEVRWLLGEDLPRDTVLKDREAIRSIKNPPLYGQPDRMSSELYYCGVQDNGGVHRNNGVGNKAAYLMADGGYFNGRQVKGIGLEKTAAIWYEAQTGLITSAADYGDLYSGLLAACSALSSSPSSPSIAPAAVSQTDAATRRIFVPVLVNSYRGSSITPADCQQVKAALEAVEMNRPPSNAACTALGITPDAPVCETGTQPSYIFFDNLEHLSSGNWTSRSMTGPNGWYYPQPLDVTYAASGRYHFFGYNLDLQADYTMSMNRNISLPPARTSYLHFKHAYEFETGSYDGGVVEYSLNNGASWFDAGQAFQAANGYNGVIDSRYGNPLGGRKAFVNLSYGYTSSRFNLWPLAGSSLRFRYRMGTDQGGSGMGWFIDDIGVYTCDAPAAAPTKALTPAATSIPASTAAPARNAP